MNAAAELRRSLESCELLHPLFDEHYHDLKRRVDDALDGYSPRIEWLIGPSRVGKTMVLDALARDYPETRTDGVRKVLVLKVPIPPAVSPKLFPVSVLQALRVPVPARSSSSATMLDRMCDQLRLAGTRVVLLEEASHFVEPSARVPPRAAGDMLKTMMDQANVTLIATGIPRLQRLFESNEQLRLRASTRRVFSPYDFGNPEHRKAFATCVRTYVDLFEKFGWPIAIEFGTFVKHCYLHCGGLIGVLSHFTRELSIRKRGEAPRPLTFEDCARAASHVEGAGHPLHKPFQSEQIAMVDLNQAYGHVLEANALPAFGKK